MSWQRIVVSTGAHVGDPGPLPANLLGLDAVTLANLPAALSPATLAQLSLQDTGFLPVADPAPTPPAVRWISVYQFYTRFTQAERAAIYASTDANVQDFLRLIGTIPTSGATLNLDDPETSGGVNYLEQHGLIAAGRAAQILS